jgi:hypothetical protein
MGLAPTSWMMSNVSLPAVNAFLSSSYAFNNTQLYYQHFVEADSLFPKPANSTDSNNSPDSAESALLRAPFTGMETVEDMQERIDRIQKIIFADQQNLFYQFGVCVRYFSKKGPIARVGKGFCDLLQHLDSHYMQVAFAHAAFTDCLEFKTRSSLCQRVSWGLSKVKKAFYHDIEPAQNALARSVNTDPKNLYQREKLEFPDLIPHAPSRYNNSK